MLLKITRGMGGPKGLYVLILTIVVGVLLLVVAIWLRHHLLKSKGVATTTLSPAQVLALSDQARGVSVQVAFVPGESARVSSYAAARYADGHWDGLAENSILKVTGVKVTEGETWVTGTVDSGKAHAPVTVHASFLERYLPVVLDRTAELSEVKLVTERTGPSPGTAVTGWLRNVTGETIFAMRRDVCVSRPQ